MISDPKANFRPLVWWFLFVIQPMRKNLVSWIHRNSNSYKLITMLAP